MKKRLFDIFCSSTILLLALPVFFIFFIIVKYSSHGPVFYGHPRIGLNGKPFLCWKFRTMFVDAEEKLEQLLDSDPIILQEWNTYYKLKIDPRITPAGKWFRKFSLDELPQLWNVLKGDMSMVGPRPLTQYEVTHILKHKSAKILSVRPGLTTVWIVRGRNRFTLKQRVKWEEFYIDHHCFFFDCRLIGQTIRTMIFPKGAY
jgi:undecaprenyl-phosphate galactose phosphotransferase